MRNSKKRPIFVLAEQLVQTWLRNEAELSVLAKLHRSTERAQAYMRKPECNETLAMAYLERIGRAHQDHLLRLRSGRRQALVLIARAEAELKSRSLARHPALERRPESSRPDRLPRQLARKYA